jgi:hypothetical protein
VLHGWAAADGDEVESSLRSRQLGQLRPHAWGLVLGSYPDNSGNGWAFGVGRTGVGESYQGSASSGGGSELAPNLFELSLQFDVGDGLLLTPGMVLVRQQGGQHTAFVGLSSAWTF